MTEAVVVSYKSSRKESRGDLPTEEEKDRSITFFDKLYLKQKDKIDDGKVVKIAIN